MLEIDFASSLHVVKGGEEMLCPIGTAREPRGVRGTRNNTTGAEASPSTAHEAWDPETGQWGANGASSQPRQQAKAGGAEARG